MKQFTFERLNICTVNAGIDIEKSIIYRLTGVLKEKHDNLKYDIATDCLQYQIKSARATVCKCSLDEYLRTDKASAYIYGTKTGLAYIMNKSEFRSFVEEFGTLTKDSAKNGGQEKIRLGHETKKMLEWLANNGAL